jgi:hypothetical protein
MKMERNDLKKYVHTILQMKSSVFDFYYTVSMYKEYFGDKSVHILLFEDMMRDINFYAEKLANILEVDREIVLRLLSNKEKMRAKKNQPMDTIQKINLLGKKFL